MLGVRRLRASSDGDSRDAAGGALVVSGPAHLGDLRAAIGDVVPARVPGRLRARVRRIRRRRSHSGVGVPVVAARRRTALGRRARSRPATRPDSARAAHPDGAGDRERPSPPKRATGDLVVVMSNGGFDGIHDKLLAARSATRSSVAMNGSAFPRATCRRVLPAPAAVRDGEPLAPLHDVPRRRAGRLAASTVRDRERAAGGPRRRARGRRFRVTVLGGGSNVVDRRRRRPWRRRFGRG